MTKSAEPPYAKVFKTDLDSELVTYNVMIDTGITLALSEATDATSSKDGQVWGWGWEVRNIRFISKANVKHE